MSYEEGNGRNRSYRNFRNSLDLGMGIFYIVIGIVVAYMKYFGTIELQGVFPYLFGGIIIAYGIFRIYRGVAAIRRKDE